MSKSSLSELKERVVKIGKKMVAKDFSAPADGNISFLFEGRYFITRSAKAKDELSVDDLIEIDKNGQSISNGKASTELELHLTVYKNRPEIQAVVHAHPPYASAFAVAHIPLDKNILSEVLSTIGSVPLAEYGTPATEELANSILPYVNRCNVILLANHGALSYGKSLIEAWQNMERLEHFARISFYARQLGPEVEISPNDTKKLLEIRRNIYKLDSPQLNTI